MLHPMWVKLPNCYLSRPTCAPLNERALWNRWNSPSLGSMEPWGVSDSEQKISATHCSKNSPFSGEVVSTHTLLPNVLNLALNRKALLWCNQTKGSINFYSYLLWDTILFGVCVTFDAYWLWELMMRFPPQIRLCRLNCHSRIVLSPDSIEFACSFASRVGFHVGDLSYHYHEVPDKALILWFIESMSLFFVFRSASDSHQCFYTTPIAREVFGWEQRLLLRSELQRKRNIASACACTIC